MVGVLVGRGAQPMLENMCDCGLPARVVHKNSPNVQESVRGERLKPAVHREFDFIVI